MMRALPYYFRQRLVSGALFFYSRPAVSGRLLLLRKARRQSAVATVFATFCKKSPRSKSIKGSKEAKGDSASTARHRGHGGCND